MFKLDLESEAEFRKYVRELISGQVRSILRAELAGIVNAEIVKLRLLQPGDTTLSQLVAKQVNATVANEIQNQHMRMREIANEQVQTMIKAALDQLVEDINKAVKRQLVTSLQRI